VAEESAGGLTSEIFREGTGAPLEGGKAPMPGHGPGLSSPAPRLLAPRRPSPPPPQLPAAFSCGPRERARGTGSQLVLAVGADALFGAMTGGDARVFLEQAASGTGISRSRQNFANCQTCQGAQSAPSPLGIHAHASRRRRTSWRVFGGEVRQQIRDGIQVQVLDRLPVRCLPRHPSNGLPILPILSTQRAPPEMPDEAALVSPVGNSHHLLMIGMA
jgi:hypothetical protein